MKVSIIIPVYNVAPYLTTCIESILTQTFTDFELLLVDDGSTDNTLSICNSYSKTDDRIKVIHKINGGVSSARNCGIDASHGEWIAFIDGDDIIEPDYLKKLLSEFNNESIDLVCCNLDIVNLNKDIESHPFTNSKIYSPLDICDQYFTNQTIKTQFYSPVNKIIRKSAIGRLRFSEFALGEVILFMFELLSQIRQVALIPYTGYHYIKRENSATTSGFNQKKLDYVRAAHEIAHLAGKISPDLQRKAKIWTLRHSIVTLRQIFKCGLEKPLDEYVKRELKFISDNKSMLPNLGFKRRIDFLLIKYFPTIYKVLPI